MDSVSSRKSMVSFGDSMSQAGDSASYSLDSKTGSVRMHSRRKSHMLKLKRRMENMPQRKLLFRPKVYDHWTEGDHLNDEAENERLLRDIAEKEKRLMAKRKGADDADEYAGSDDEDQLVKQLEKMKSRKQREIEFRAKLEEEKRKKEEEEMLELEEKLRSELQNPSIYGWYFTDGYYDNAPFFGVRQDLVEKLNGEQQQWWENWSKKYPETFTDKFRRFFWPPKLLCKKRSFRTRGSYLDFPEVIADWPKAVDVNFERELREYISNRHELFGIDEEQKELDELEEAQARAEAEAAAAAEEGKEDESDADMIKKLHPAGAGAQIDLSTLGIQYKDAYNWYYDDDEGNFYPKRLGFDIDYYYDGLNHCWRHKKKRGKYKTENQQTPYDFYYDDVTSNFLPREEYGGIDEMVWDKKNACFRIHVIAKTGKQTRKGSKAFIAPKPAVTESDTDSVQFDEKGRPFLLPQISENKKNKPRDFYFDEEYGKYFSTAELPPNVTTDDIVWDENGRRRTRKFEGVWRGLTGLSPDDYYWSDRIRKFVPKPPRQGNKFKYFAADGVWRKEDEVTAMNALHSDDIALYYFDDLEGQFKPKDLHKSHHARYIQGKYSKIWRKVAEPKSGLYPEDFYWDTYKKRWLPRSIRMEMLKNAEMAHQAAIISGQQPGILAIYDIKQHDKDTKKEDFYFDFEEGVFLKKRPNVSYIFDEDNGVFTMESMKNRTKNVRYPHDFYFDPRTGEFNLKEQSQSYVYDNQFHIWKKDSTDLTNYQKQLEDWYFDMSTEEWMKKGKGGDSGVILDPIYNIQVRAKSGKVGPDNFFFDDVDGRFYQKDAHDAHKGKYYYDPTTGVWKHKDLKDSGPPQNGLNPRNYFFDDQSKTFKLMIRDRVKIDYFFDTKNKIYRHIAASGRTKSGFRPSDFAWNSDLKAYIPVAALKKGRVDPNTGGIVQWEPLREYDKPWIVEAPMRNPDSTKMDQRKTPMDKEGKSKSLFKWLTGKNKVDPAESSDDIRMKRSTLQKQREEWVKKF